MPKFQQIAANIDLTSGLLARLDAIEAAIEALSHPVGVTDGSNAAPGQVGEYLTASGSHALANAIPQDVATLVLPAGDWDVSGSAAIGVSLPNMTVAWAWLNNVSNTPGAYGPMMISVGGQATAFLNVGPVRYLVAAPSTQTVYLGCQANFPSGTVNGQASIVARRVR